MGLPESFFWHAPIATLKTVIENKRAYDGWVSSEHERLYGQNK